MQHFAKLSLVVAVSLALGACAANKGGFGVSAVSPPPSHKPEVPKLVDVQTEPRTAEELDAMMQPALGFETSLLERAWIPEEESRSFDAKNIKAIDDKLADVSRRHKQEIYQSGRHGGTIQDSFEPYGNFFLSRDRGYMQFVKSGWIADLNTRLKKVDGVAYKGMQGKLFYLGENPATALPTGGQVQYKGSWDFATNAIKGRSLPSSASNGEKGGAGDWYGLFSYHESIVSDPVLRSEGVKEPVAHSSAFTVDFGKKTLEGKLTYNKGSQVSQDRYDISATLHGNRFRGKATALNKEDVYFGADSSSLEGGFFGDNAEELAGKFLADDNSLFAVFGARQHKDGAYATADNIAATEKAFDAVQISDSFEQQAMTTFGDATKLVINGRSFSLLPATADGKFVAHTRHDLSDNQTLVVNACCDNLGYVKFGNYFTETGDVKNGVHLFLTGERTPLAQMLNTGKFDYIGSWEAMLLSTDQRVGSVSANDKNGGARALFGVDFDNKTLVGSLYQDNGVTPSILITDGKISGNGFTGKFKSRDSGFLLDSATNQVAHVSGEVKGGFYGPNAVELGGYFSSNDADKDKIGGVFGAKQQVLSNDK